MDVLQLCVPGLEPTVPLDLPRSCKGWGDVAGVGQGVVICCDLETMES